MWTFSLGGVWEPGSLGDVGAGIVERAKGEVSGVFESLLDGLEDFGAFLEELEVETTDRHKMKGFVSYDVHHEPFPVENPPKIRK